MILRKKTSLFSTVFSFFFFIAALVLWKGIYSDTVVKVTPEHIETLNYSVIWNLEQSEEASYFTPEYYVKFKDLKKDEHLKVTEEEYNQVKDFLIQVKKEGQVIFDIIENVSAPTTYLKKQLWEEKVEYLHPEKIDRGDVVVISKLKNFLKTQRHLIDVLFDEMEGNDIYGLAYWGSEVSHNWLKNSSSFVPVEPFILYNYPNNYILSLSVEAYSYWGGDFCSGTLPPQCSPTFIDDDINNYCVGLVKNKIREKEFTSLIYAQIFGKCKKMPSIIMELILMKKIKYEDEEKNSFLERRRPIVAGLKFDKDEYRKTKFDNKIIKEEKNNSSKN